MAAECINAGSVHEGVAITDGEQMMVERQRILANFGEFALRSDDLDDVLTRACSLVGKALHTDLAKVMEIEDETLFVRAGVGWPSGVVGEVRLPMREKSSETYAVKMGEPIVTADIAKEDRFIFPDFLKRAGVVGIVNVPIFLPGGKAYGLLQVDSREVWNPTPDDIEFLRTYSTILGPVIDRLHKLHALQAAQDKNKTLLNELQHRVKNNIAVVGALIRMRRKRVQSAEAREELTIIGERIDVLQLAHERVYAAEAGDRLPLRRYATELLTGVLALRDETKVQLQTEIDDVEVTSDLAIPLGLILNEFATNSLKYAFHGVAPENRCITLEVRQREMLSVCISDNGTGLPIERQEARPGAGTGMAIIEGLALQIGATPHWSSTGGTALRLEVPGRLSATGEGRKRSF